MISVIVGLLFVTTFALIQ